MAFAFIQAAVHRSILSRRIETMWEYQIAAGNAGWRLQFRFAVHAGWSRVPELWTFDMSEHDQSLAEAIATAAHR